MKPHEFRRLYAIPYDIEKRRQRIERLELMQADGPQAASDVVKASHGDGNACILGHVTVTGTTDAAYNQRMDEIRRLKKINQAQGKLYNAGVHMIEECQDPALRAMLSAVCVEGKKPQDVAIELAEQGFDIDADAIRQRIRRWISKNV